MLAGGYSWRLFFYVEAAFAAALLVMAFFFVEESTYHRETQSTPQLSSSDSLNIGDKDVKLDSPQLSFHASASATPMRKKYLSTLKPWSSIDHDAEFTMTMLRSFTYFLVPAVFWVIASYASFIGYLLALPFTSSSDRLAAYRTKRNNGIREAEMRLPVLFPVMLLPPAGLIVYGFTAQHNLHWVGYFAGVAMNMFGSYFYFTFTLAYAVDSYYANTSEMLIAMNLGKQAISFGMGSYLLDWILDRGYAVVISGIFGGVLLANNLAVVIFIIFGKRIRRWTANSWLGRLHKRTATRDMTQ
ncbi:MFS transporter [Penicillium herquei]|nr:MFS transporter [Penicillium herquei]